MVCIYCSGATKITNSRPQKRTSGTWRRHLCAECGAIFSSLERVDYASSLSFLDGTSHIVPFDRDKLLISVYDACRHRPSAIQDASALVETIIGQILRHPAERGLITRVDLIAVVLRTLKHFDRAATTYYAAYHRS